MERLRNMYADAARVTSDMRRQSLEFGESSLSTVKRAQSRVRKQPLTCMGIVALCLLILQRYYRRPRQLAAARNSAALAQAFASTAGALGAAGAAAGAAATS